jgi:hypothetical protein
MYLNVIRIKLKPLRAGKQSEVTTQYHWSVKIIVTIIIIGTTTITTTITTTTLDAVIYHQEGNSKFQPGAMVHLTACCSFCIPTHVFSNWNLYYWLPTKCSGPSNFERFDVRTTWNSNRNSKVEQRITWSSRGRLLSLLGPDERRVIHLAVNSNIPPTIIIDWLLYNIVYVCTIININFQLLKLNILVLSLWSFEMGT